jgi:hypothetical protein
LEVSCVGFGCGFAALRRIAGFPAGWTLDRSTRLGLLDAAFPSHASQVGKTCDTAD